MITAMKRGVFMPQYKRDYTEEVCTNILFGPLQMKVGVLTKSFMLEMMEGLYNFKKKRPRRCTQNVEMPMSRHLRIKEEVTSEQLTHIAE